LAGFETWRLKLGLELERITAVRFWGEQVNLNTEMNFAAKERTDRKIRDLRAIPWRFIAHLASEFSDFFKFLTLCSLRSFAANHFPF
jgi:hypothetical protein